MLSGCLGSVKDFDGACARYDDFAIRKADPVIGILLEQTVALYPILVFVFLPVWMHSFGNFRGQTID